MTKREVLQSMINKMDEFDKYDLSNDPNIKTAYDIHCLHMRFIDEALAIATDSGFDDGVKWQLWEEVCKYHSRKILDK